MKRSIRFLPPNKRQDLQQLVALIREHIKRKADIDALLPKVEELRNIVKIVCRDRIAYYDSQIKK